VQISVPFEFSVSNAAPHFFRRPSHYYGATPSSIHQKYTATPTKEVLTMIISSLTEHMIFF